MSQACGVSSDTATRGKELSCEDPRYHFFWQRLGLCTLWVTVCVCVCVYMCVLSPSAHLSACLSHLSLDTLQFHDIPRRDITSSFGMQRVGSNVNLPTQVVLGKVRFASFVTCLQTHSCCESCSGIIIF